MRSGREGGCWLYGSEVEVEPFRDARTFGVFSNRSRACVGLASGEGSGGLFIRSGISNPTVSYVTQYSHLGYLASKEQGARENMLTLYAGHIWGPLEGIYHWRAI